MIAYRKMNKPDIIWKALLRATKTGAPCPTNSELSKLAGFTHEGSADRYLKEWRESGVIQVEKHGQTKRKIGIDGYWTAWTKPTPAEGIIQEPEITNRRCLCCRAKFASAWAGERICKRCKATADWRGAAMA